MYFLIIMLIASILTLCIMYAKRVDSEICIAICMTIVMLSSTVFLIGNEAIGHNNKEYSYKYTTILNNNNVYSVETINDLSTRYCITYYEEHNDEVIEKSIYVDKIVLDSDINYNFVVCTYDLYYNYDNLFFSFNYKQSRGEYKILIIKYANSFVCIN